ncbi:MAG: hypothetical protein ACRDYW_04120, partial [Acidimicrobiales bacterium]
VDSSPNAVAGGFALLTPVFESPNLAVKSGTDTETASDCQEVPIPAELDVATARAVCLETTAKLIDGLPKSTSLAQGLVLEVKAPAVIGDTPLNDVVTEIRNGVGSLFDALVPVTEPLEEATQVELTSILDGILAEVQEGDVLVRITVEPSSTVSERTAGTIGANAVSNGLIVELLPDMPGGALAVATVGESTAGVVRDVATGAPTLTGSHAVIDVAYPNGLAGGLEVLTGALESVVNVPVTQLACGPDNPLSDVLCFTIGATNDLDQAEAAALGLDFGPTTVGRETSVLSLSLLAAAPEGGVVLHVGHTAAAAGAAYVAPEAPGLPRVDNPLEEARTGGGDAALPLTLGLLAVGTAGAVLVRRTRTTV